MLEGEFRKPFPEQIAAFRLRLGNQLPTRAWDDIRKEAHDRAFIVAGATKADLLTDLGGAVDAAITDGETLDQFRARFRDIVETQGWHGWTGEGTKAGENWRTKIIYRTNMKTSYAAGRLAQLRKGNFPLWVYRHGGSEHPRENHLALDGLILPSDHPFWSIYYPPNGWGCSCYVLGARSEAGAKRLGGKPSVKLPDNWREIDPRTGEPAGIGKGWGYAPGGTVSDTINALAPKFRSWPDEIAKQVLAEWLQSDAAAEALGVAGERITEALIQALLTGLRG